MGYEGMGVESIEALKEWSGGIVGMQEVEETKNPDRWPGFYVLSEYELLTSSH